MTLQHAPLRVRKAVLARLIVHEAIEPILGRGPTNDDVFLVADEVIQAVYGATKSEIDSPLAEPLDVFIQSLIGKAAQSIEEHRRLAGNHTLEPAVKSMRQRAAGLSCASCTGGEPACDGNTARDATMVERAGHCIEPFRSLFVLAEELVRAHYAYALGPQVLNQWPRTSFVTDFNAPGLKAHPFQSPAQIFGAARRTGDAATIELIFSPQDFNWAGYLAAAYVLVHEAVHVMEGIETSAMRMPASPEDPFVEGWMDWIAFQMFDRTARGRGPARHLAPRYVHATAHRERSRELHSSRFDAETSTNKMLSYRLLAGKRAAEQFYDFCRRSVSRNEACRLFLEISFRFNARALDLNANRRVTARVSEQLPLPNIPLHSPISTPARRLRELLRKGDATGAVEWLLE